jgi:DNA-binding NtrC family response regulator
MKFDRLPAKGQDGRGRTSEVLIADDDSASMAVLRRAFGLRGLDCVAFRDGRRAWAEILGNRGISMAVVNWILPGMGGMEICQLARRQRPDVATVLLVGQAFLRDAWAAMDYKPHYVITKPLAKTGIDLVVSRIAQDALLC